jgi:hypothetical protein
MRPPLPCCGTEAPSCRQTSSDVIQCRYPRDAGGRARRGAAAFFMQSEPPAFAMLEVVADLHRNCGTEAREVVDHGPDQRSVAQGPRYRSRWVDVQNASVVRCSNSCRMAARCCLTVGLDVRLLNLLDVCFDRDGFDLVKVQAPFVTPVEEQRSLRSKFLFLDGRWCRRGGAPNTGDSRSDRWRMRRTMH